MEEEAVSPDSIGPKRPEREQGTHEKPIDQEVNLLQLEWNHEMSYENREGLFTGEQVEENPIDPFFPEIQEFRKDIENFYLALVCSSSDPENIRSWGERPRSESIKNIIESNHYVLTDKDTPSLKSDLRRASFHEDADDRPSLTASYPALPMLVFAWGEGIYRGQIRAEINNNIAIPEGMGIYSTPSGSIRAGKWSDEGSQCGFGTQSEQFLNYEGEWKSSLPHGYGVGFFPFGAIFFGVWSRGQPSGLGILHDLKGLNQVHSTKTGWFNGLNLLQPIETQDQLEEKQIHQKLQRVRVPIQFVEQPLRGLHIVCQVLERNRLGSYRRLFDCWRRFCVDQVIHLAKKSRLLGFLNWKKAKEIEAKAIRFHLDTSLGLRKLRQDEMLIETQKARQQHQGILHVMNQFDMRIEDATHRARFTKRCVETQQENIDLLEKELQQIMEVLVQSKASQKKCAEMSHRLQVTKRQIENTSVRINYLKREILRIDQHRNGIASRNTLYVEPERNFATPATASQKQQQNHPPPPHSHSKNHNNSRKHSGGADILVLPGQRGKQEDEIPSASSTAGDGENFCDVPGCKCGIPRDLFIRVGGVLKNDH
jgi:hypothetical protein